MHEFTSALKQEAERLGFVLSGVCPAATPPHYRQFLAWLDQGCAGTMHYLPDRREAYRHPSSVLDGCRTIVMLGIPYDPGADTTPSAQREGTRGRVARYARCDVDYHDVVHRRLKQLKQFVLTAHPDAKVRGVVDTAPLLERDFAQLAGLGWIGKNTMLINKAIGSYFFLAALLTDLELAIDAPHVASHCGRCRACLDACPTEAFPSPFHLNARRCISYLTIEHRGQIAPDLQDQLAGWVFGCDVCQEVCPWNRKASECDPAFEAKYRELDLLELIGLDDEQFRSRFRRTPMWRTRRFGMLRNAILLLASNRVMDAVPRLESLLRDADPQVRLLAAWGISRLKPDDWRSRITAAIAAEDDSELRDQLAQYLEST